MHHEEDITQFFKPSIWEFRGPLLFTEQGSPYMLLELLLYLIAGLIHHLCDYLTSAPDWGRLKRAPATGLWYGVSAETSPRKQARRESRRGKGRGGEFICIPTLCLCLLIPSDGVSPVRSFAHWTRPTVQYSSAVNFPTLMTNPLELQTENETKGKLSLKKERLITAVRTGRCVPC